MPFDFTDEDIANTVKSLGLEEKPQTAPEVSALSRAGMAVANFPSNVANTFVNTASGFLAPQDRMTDMVPRPYNPPPGQTFAQKAVDVVGEQFLPQAAAFALPYGGLKTIGAAAGLGGVALETAAQAGAGAIMSPEHPIEGGLVGAGLGSVSGLSRAARILPLAGMAGAGTAYGVSQGQNLKDATIQNAVQFSFGVLPGQHSDIHVTGDPTVALDPVIISDSAAYSAHAAQSESGMRLMPTISGEAGPPIQNQSYGLHPTVEPSTEGMQLLPSGYVPHVPETLPTNFPDTSGMRLQTGQFIPHEVPEGGIQNAQDVSTRGMILRDVNSDRINRALGIDVQDQPLKDLNEQLAILQSQPKVVEAPTVEDLGLKQPGTRRAYAAAKTIEAQPLELSQPSEPAVLPAEAPKPTPLPSPEPFEKWIERIKRGPTEVRDQVTGQPNPHPMVAKFEDWANSVIQKKSGQLFSGIPDPELTAAYAVKGAFFVSKGIKDFGEWAATMIAQFGESVKPHLQAAWDHITKVSESPAENLGVGRDIVDAKTGEKIKYDGPYMGGLGEQYTYYHPEGKAGHPASEGTFMVPTMNPDMTPASELHTMENVQKAFTKMTTKFGRPETPFPSESTKSFPVEEAKSQVKSKNGWGGTTVEPNMKATLRSPDFKGKIEVQVEETDGKGTYTVKVIKASPTSGVPVGTRFGKIGEWHLEGQYPEESWQAASKQKAESATLQNEHPILTKVRELDSEYESVTKELKLLVNKNEILRTKISKNDDLVRNAIQLEEKQHLRNVGEKYLIEGKSANDIVDSPIADITMQRINEAQNAFLDNPLQQVNKEQIEAVFEERKQLNKERDLLSSQIQEIRNKQTAIQKELIKNTNNLDSSIQRAVDSFYSQKRAQNKSATLQMKKPTGNNLSGQISAPAMFALGRAAGGAAVGGTLGYKETEGDWKSALGWALVGAAAGVLASPELMQGFIRGSEPALERLSKGEKPTKAIAKAEVESLKKVAATPLVDLAGQAINGRGTFSAKVARSVEQLTNKLMTSEQKTALSQASGQVESICMSITKAFKEAANYKPNTDVLERVGKYLKGQLTDGSEAKNLIASEGGIDHNAWKASKKADREGLDSIWRVGEVIGDKAKDDAGLFHISQATRDKLVNLEQENLFKNLTGTDLAFAKTMQTSRLAMNSLQQIIQKAMPQDSNIANIIANSYDQYLTRRFGLFQDIKPTEAQILAAAKQWGLKQGSAILQEEQTKGNAYSAGAFHEVVGSQPSENWSGFQELTHEHQIAPGSDATEVQKWMVSPETMERYKLSTDSDMAYAHIEQKLKDYKTNREALGTHGLDTTLLKEREMLSPTYRELLGEFKNPVEQMAHALNAIIPMAKAANRINALGGMKDFNGLKNYFESYQEWAKAKNDIQNQLESAKASGNPETAKALQSKLSYLLTYQETGDNLKFGFLKGGEVSRALSDQLLGLQGGWGDFEHALSRGWMKSVNNYTKMIHLSYNPAMHARQIIQLPILMAVGRVTPTRGFQAFGAMAKYASTGKASPEVLEGIHQGILHGTYVSGELGVDFSNIASGAEGGFWRSAHQKVLDFYNTADASARLASYFAAKDRIAGKMGITDLQHPEVIAKAINFVNDHNFNYENIAPAVKLLRNIPMFNLYASYTFEVARITKNLLKDVAFGDLGDKIHAATMLAGIAAIPEILQRVSTSNLSEEDRKAWEASQKLQPDYARTRYKFVFGRDEKGLFHYLDFTNIVPHNDWGQMGRAIAGQDWKAAGAVNPLFGVDKSPILNIISQQIQGKDLHSQRDFRGYQDRIANLTRELLPTYTPGVGYDWNNFMQSGVTNERTGKRLDFEDNVLKMVTGLSNTTVNPAILQRAAHYQFTEKLQLEKQYYKDVMQTDLPQERKDHATKVFQTAVNALIQDYTSKVVQPEK